MIIFSLLILLGFRISTHSLPGRRAVAVIYIFALLWYTMLCRLSIFTSVPTYGGDTTSSVPTTAPSTADKIGQVVVEIFGLQPDGTLAGGGVGPALFFNAMLFIPLGYLVLIWLLQLVQIRSEKRDKQDKQGPWREGQCSRITAVAICTVVSILIELLQSLTGLGIADVKDVIGNCIGSVIGVVMVMLYERKRAARG